MCVCNRYIIYDQVNVTILFYNFLIVLNCTTHFVYSPLNLYLIYMGYWTLNIIFLLLHSQFSSSE